MGVFSVAVLRDTLVSGFTLLVTQTADGYTALFGFSDTGTQTNGITAEKKANPCMKEKIKYVFLNKAEALEVHMKIIIEQQ